MTARNHIRLKAVIVGDSDVLKTIFLIQIAGRYDRDRVGTFLTAHMQDHLMDFMIYNEVGEIAIWNTCKFIAHK